MLVEPGWGPEDNGGVGRGTLGLREKVEDVRLLWAVVVSQAIAYWLRSLDIYSVIQAVVN